MHLIHLRRHALFEKHLWTNEAYNDRTCPADLAVWLSTILLRASSLRQSSCRIILLYQHSRRVASELSPEDENPSRRETSDRKYPPFDSIFFIAGILAIGEYFFKR